MNLTYCLTSFVIMSAVILLCNTAEHICTTGNHIQDVDGRRCSRTCHKGGAPLRCHFDFTLESYYVLSQACFNCPYNVTDCYRPDCVAIDGHQRYILTANRKLPGPSIEVCRDDTIIVNVNNQADPQATSIHWHGIKQTETPYMDGVPMVTQCPIQPFDTFRYVFKVPDSGTYFWHAHIAAQKADGLAGVLIVRNPEDQKIYKYDHDLSEHAIMINDWYNTSIIEIYAKTAFYKVDLQPYNILVNGRGRHTNFTSNGKVIHTPLAVFKVKQGKRFRFRVIGSNFQCGIQVSIDGHQLEIIASDGRPVEPKVVDGVNVLAGERYDFVLNADKPIGNYWMKFRGLDSCDERKVSAYQMAILRYIGAPNEDPEEIPSYGYSVAKGYVLNPVVYDSPTMQGAVTTLRSTMPNDRATLNHIPDFQYIIEYDFRLINNSIYNWPLNYHGSDMSLYHPNTPIPMLNYIQNTFPPAPLLTQYNSVPQNLICDEESLLSEGKDCTKELCLCTHVVKVPLDSVAQFVLIDDGIFALDHVDHPIHLHGHCFHVLAMGRFNESNLTAAKVRQLATEHKLVLNLDHAVKKDTVNVPNGGYAVIRFLAENPGFWLLHCHIDVHLKIGMALIVQVGEVEDHPKPPKDFPKCGNF